MHLLLSGVSFDGFETFVDPHAVQGDASVPESQLDWTCMDEPSWKLDNYSLKPLEPPPHYTVESDELDYHDYSLVISGDVFRWMINYAPLETLQRVSSHTFDFLTPVSSSNN